MMEQFERNLDAYRILAEVLADLRQTVHEGLSNKYGAEWYRTGINPPLLDRLILRKEREKAIDWYETEYQQLIDFASFPDLLEIIEKDPDVVPYMEALAPSPPLVHARFLELSVLNEKLALARPLSESELSFLAVFHIRFRKAVSEYRAGERSPVPAAAVLDGRPATQPLPTMDAKAGPPPAPTEPKEDAQPTEAKAPEGEAEVSAKAADEAAADSSKAKKKQRPAAAKATPPVVPTNPVALEEAMDRSDHISVLRALYQEVTAIAEGLWANSSPPGAPIWDKISTSAWYSENFSGLGMRPVSDFYELVAQVRTKLQEGGSEADVQNLLKEQRFAQVLLAMRDMFQKHQI